MDDAVNRAVKYPEILSLYGYCKEIGINATLEELRDGYKILFSSGGDIAQHANSYGGGLGYVEPAIGCKIDYTSVELKKAKRLLRKNKIKLNISAGKG